MDLRRILAVPVRAAALLALCAVLAIAAGALAAGIAGPAVLERLRLGDPDSAMRQRHAVLVFARPETLRQTPERLAPLAAAAGAPSRAQLMLAGKAEEAGHAESMRRWLDLDASAPLGARREP